MTREEAVKWLSNLKNDLGQMQYQQLWHYAEAIDGIIKTLQTDIVRCGECEHYRRVDEDHVVVPYCGTFLAETELTDFCSYGERRG